MAPPEQIRRLIGVYNAEGSLSGELRYLVGRARGTAHCELCDVTHGWLRKKRAFAAFQTTAPVPIELLHLDEQPREIAAVTEGRTPCVLAETATGHHMVLETAAIARCAGDVQQFAAALGDAIRSQNLVLPNASAEA